MTSTMSGVALDNWADVLTSALLGTDRRPLVFAHQGEDRGSFPDDPHIDPAEALLDRAALCRSQRLATAPCPAARRRRRPRSRAAHRPRQPPPSSWASCCRCPTRRW